MPLLVVIPILIVATCFQTIVAQAPGNQSASEGTSGGLTNSQHQPVNDLQPEEMDYPSDMGVVHFPHQLHYDEMEIECSECHHEVNASTLSLGHKYYFEDFWINCNTCHFSHEGEVGNARACSGCHRRSGDLVDESSSVKVVLHKVCWECHEAERGVAASRTCRNCHYQPKPASSKYIPKQNNRGPINGKKRFS